MEDLLTVKEAAEYLGMNAMTVRRLYRAGLLSYTKRGGGRIYFRRIDLEKVKTQEYPEGLGHTEIAARYNVKRTLVWHHFKRLKVKPMGVNRGGNSRAVYDLKTVKKFARILGWIEPQSRIDESSTPDLAISSDA